MTPKINLTDLRRIVREELKLNETVDHAAIRDIVTDASKLLAAVESFKSTASISAKNAVTPHIDQIEKVLEDMVSTPGSYVAKPKLVPKKVTLRQVKSEGKLSESVVSDCAKTIHGFIKGENKDKKSAADAFNTLQSKGVIKSKASLGAIVRVMNDLSKGRNVNSEDLQDADSALTFLF
jgi:hypothetical protein